MCGRLEVVHITTVSQTLGFFRGHIRHLQDEGFDVSVVASPDDLLYEFSRVCGVTSIGVPMSRRPDIMRDLQSLWTLVKRLRQAKPDIVHSHTPKAGLLGTLAARITGTPIVVVSIFGLPQMTRSGWSAKLLNMVTWANCRMADLVWSDSPSMREYLIQSGICDASKIVVIGKGSVHGVDAQGRFCPDNIPAGSRKRLRSELHIPENATVLGFVGRIVADKGIRELASAWRLLRDRYPDLHLLLVGEMEEDDPISQEDKDLFTGDERVKTPGHRRDVPECLQAMDLFVMPSYREGFGVANIEAAAMELPVVSTCIPGCIDSVHNGVTGTLVPPRNAEALYLAIVEYLDDPELARSRGMAGRERVLRDFRPEILESGLRKEYLKLWTRKSKLR